MSVETVLILNSVGLGLGVVAIVVLLGLLIRAERKLAPYGKSWMFKRRSK